LKSIVISEILETGKSENLSAIIQKMKYTYKNETTINSPTLSFEDSQDIVISTINSVISEKENLINIDPTRYTKIMIFILTTLLISNHIFGSSSPFSKNEDPTCNALMLIPSNVQDLLVHECLFDPVHPEEFALWAQQATNTDILRMSLRISDIYQISNIFPKYKSNGFGFDGTLFVNENLSFTGRITFFESFLFVSKFWNSTSPQVYRDAFILYQKFIQKLQARSLRSKNPSILEDAYQTNNRFCRTLMSTSTKTSSEFRLGVLSEAFSSPLALEVGSLVNKNYHNDLFQMISSIPVTSDDPINVPFTVAVTLIMQSECSELPSLRVICPILVEKLLVHCYSNAKPNIKYNIKPSYCPISYLYSGDYTSFIHQYMNEIDQHQFLGLEDKFTRSQWQPQFIPHIACKDYEKILSTPKVGLGQSFVTAAKFFKSTVENDKFEKREHTSQLDMMKNLHSVLSSSIESIKKCLIEIPQPPISVEYYMSTNNQIVSINNQLILSPTTVSIFTALTNNDLYELICGDESSYQSLLFVSFFNFNRNFRKTLNEFQSSKNFIIQILSQNEDSDEIKCIKKEAAILRDFNSSIFTQISHYQNEIQTVNKSIQKINSLIGSSFPILEKHKIVFQPKIQYDFENIEEQVANFLCSTILKLDFKNIMSCGCDSLSLNSIVSLIHHFLRNAMSHY
jgi:hypothetical protein